MSNNNSIEKREKLIQALNSKIGNLKKTEGISKWLNLGRYEKELKRLNNLQFYQIDDLLHSTDESYKQIVDKNYELLKTEKLQFTIYANGYSHFGNYTKQVNGSIYPNGYSYSYSAKSNFAFLPFDSIKYPKELTGKIDYWGRLRIKTTKVGYGFFKTLPEKLYGYVGSNGFLKIDNIKYDWEFFTKNTMGKLIANHFEYDEIKNEGFQNNKALLSDKIHEYWNELKG